MRARWEGLHAALVESVTTLEMHQQFDHAQKARPELQPFPTVTRLLEFLEDESSSLEDKNVIYRELVCAAQARAAWADFAKGVLWCGLWPGLDAVYRRQRRYFVDEPEELSALISLVFTALVDELDTRRVRRVAATLVRSTGREVARVRQRRLAIATHAEPARVVPPAAGSVVGPAGQAEPVSALEDLHTPRASRSVLGIPPGMSPDAQAAAVYQWLQGTIGDDAALFFAVTVFGESSYEIAMRLGLSHVAVRKRIQRIRTRLQKSMSQLAPEIGMYPVEGSHTLHTTGGSSGDD